MKHYPEKLVNYIQNRYKTRLNKEKLMELLTNYNSVYDESQKLLINMVFESLFGLTIESLNNLALNNLALNYNGIELTLDDTITEIQQNINDLSSKIILLSQENEELRENYWRLNQSIVKHTGK
tara:strand:- start:298 stop:669 length:372 start_codon:yes stop_codon:yes gene_type:complete